MSTKCSMVYANTKDFMIHVFYDYKIEVGYAIDIRFKEHTTRLLIDKKQAEILQKELSGVD